MPPLNVPKIRHRNKLNLRDVLCPICTTIFIEPVSLPCKHILCKQCLEKTVECNHLNCPICRARIGSFLRLSRTRGGLVDQVLWRNVKDQFPIEIRRKQNGEENLIGEGLFENQHTPIKLAQRGSIKEEFEQMLQKIKNEETRSRRANEVASEKLAHQIMEEEMKEENNWRQRQQEIEKANLIFIQSLLSSETCGRCSGESTSESSSSLVNGDYKTCYQGRDSITAELRHFTPICIMPKTPPKILPNGKLHETKLLRPVNMTCNVDDREVPSVGQQSLSKSSLTVYSNNFVRTKSDENSGNGEDVAARDESMNIEISQDLVNFPPMPHEVIKHQERIELQIQQEKNDLELAIKLQAEYDNVKLPQRRHSYMLRSDDKVKKRYKYS